MRCPGVSILCLSMWIVCSPGNLALAQEASAFRFRPEVDVPILVSTAAISSAWYFGNVLEPPACAPVCQRDELPAFDRFAAGTWRPGWNLASNLGFTTLATLSLTPLIAFESSSMAALTDMLVVLETVLVSSATTTTLQMATRRPRPYMYGTQAPRNRRELGTSALSLPSGHTANAFALTTAVGLAAQQLRPNGPHTWIIWSFGYTASSFVGLSRVLSGHHFPSDALIGAVTGTAIGWLVPALHRKAWSLQIVPVSDGHYALLRRRF